MLKQKHFIPSDKKEAAKEDSYRSEDKWHIFNGLYRKENTVYNM